MTGNRKPVGDEVAGLLSPVIVATGTFAYVSGQGPLVDGGYEPSSIEVETQRTLDNLARHVTACGATLADVVRCGVFMTDLDDFDAMNAVYSRFFPSPRPARTTVQVAALPGAIKIEIDCVVVLPSGPR